MLAAVMGILDIPEKHLEFSNFYCEELLINKSFDLAICDGQVLRNHKLLGYCTNNEARRLASAQLILGLRHLRNGGTMIILLHTFEKWSTVLLISELIKFGEVQAFKPQGNHAIISSFYLVVSKVKAEHPDALKALERWVAIWKECTLLTETDSTSSWKSTTHIEKIPLSLGDSLCALGESVWETQARALQKAAFMRNI